MQESLGYIGSSATVNDIIKGEFPLDIQLTDIDGFIEVTMNIVVAGLL